MPDAQFSRRSPRDIDRQIVSIVTVDLNSASPTATGIARLTRHEIVIDIRYAVGEIDVVPAVGEQWYINRHNGVWRLDARIPFQYPALAIEPTQGQVKLGSGNGPVELVGTQVNCYGPLRIGDIVYRSNQGTLERNAGTDEEPLWVTVGPQTTDDLDEGEQNLYFTPERAAAAAPVQDDDPRLGDTRTPAAGTQPYDLSVVVFGPARLRAADSYGDFPFGIKLQRAVEFTSVTFRGHTADASGNLVAELRRNGTQVAGTSTSIAAASQVSGATSTGSWSFAAGDVLSVYVTGVGTTPGLGLIADIKGSV